MSVLVDLTKPIVKTPKGDLEVPLDRAAIAELERAFGALSLAKQEWLLTRFPFAESDEEATALLNRNRVEGKTLSHESVRKWKQRDVGFKRAYTLLSGRLVDWARYMAMQIEAGNAILGALEARQILLVPWKDLDARGTTAKMQAAQSALDRVLGKRQEVDIKVARLVDLIPRKEGNYAVEGSPLQSQEDPEGASSSSFSGE